MAATVAMTIYIIGDDLTRIYGAYSTREAAEAHAKAHPTEYNEIIEIEVDDDSGDLADRR